MSSPPYSKMCEGTNEVYEQKLREAEAMRKVAFIGKYNFKDI